VVIKYRLVKLSEIIFADNLTKIISDNLTKIISDNLTKRVKGGRNESREDETSQGRTKNYMKK